MAWPKNCGQPTKGKQNALSLRKAWSDGNGVCSVSHRAGVVLVDRNGRHVRDASHTGLHLGPCWHVAEAGEQSQMEHLYADLSLVLDTSDQGV